MHQHPVTVSAPMPDAGLTNWTKKFMRTNYWRVAGFMEPEDFWQETFRVYTRCYWRYGDLPKPTFMAKYMRALTNRTHDLATDASRWRKFVREADLNMGEVPHGNADLSPLERLYEAECSGDLQDFLTVITEAPNAQVRRVLTEFLGHKSALLAPAIQQRVRQSTETPTQYICRLLGIDHAAGLHLVRQCREYLHGSVSTA